MVLISPPERRQNRVIKPYTCAEKGKQGPERQRRPPSSAEAVSSQRPPLRRTIALAAETAHGSAAPPAPRFPIASYIPGAVKVTSPAILRGREEKRGAGQTGRMGELARFDSLEGAPLLSSPSHVNNSEVGESTLTRLRTGPSGRRGPSLCGRAGAPAVVGRAASGLTRASATATRTGCCWRSS
jgi:hypothetical protein